jgi:hypothetical protein
MDGTRCWYGNTYCQDQAAANAGAGVVCAFDPCRRSVARDDSLAGVAGLDGELWGTPGSIPDVAIPDGSISLGGPIVTAVV